MGRGSTTAYLRFSVHDPKGNVIFETWQQSADGSWFFVIETWFTSLFSSCLVPKHITENWKHSKESEPSLKNALFQNWEYSSRILSIYMLLYAITILESVKGFFGAVFEFGEHIGAFPIRWGKEGPGVVWGWSRFRSLWFYIHTGTSHRLHRWLKLPFIKGVPAVNYEIKKN